MAFRNELTHMTAVKGDEVEGFHSRYENALEEVLDEISRPEVHPNIVGGQGTPDRKTFTKVSPIDQEMLLGHFQLGSSEDVDRAVRAAQQAFLPWSHQDYVERVQVFEKAARLFQMEKYQLAAALTLDNGKNRYEALADIDEAIDFMKYYANQMRLHDGFEVLLPPAYDNERAVSYLRPYGVWSVICPFNFPVAISIGMSAAAMLTGNTVVLKPSSVAPFALYKAFKLLEEAGLPDGVANLVAGSGKEVGAALSTHPHIQGVVFTGSKEVGFEIMRNSLREHPIPVIAEMGSKNPVIVTQSAKLDDAVEGVVASAYGYGGQKCSACARVYVQNSVMEPFEQLLLERVRRLQVRDPRDIECSFGPVIEERKVQEYLSCTAQGKRDGQLLAGGKRMGEGDMRRGNFVEPAVISALPQEHELVRKELFLPILVIQTFDLLSEAMQRANSSAYGLTAGIFSSDQEEIAYFFRHVQSGVVYANRRKGACTGAIVGAQSFTGWKASGSTGKGTGGPHYLQQFLREQTRTVAW
jgi:1-pyrroline-5-carboxylate dehydrogenase